MKTQQTGTERKTTNSRRPLLIFHPDTLATLNARPEDYSPIVSESRLKSLRYALAGWLYMLRYQKNTRIQAVFSVAAMALALWLGLPPRDWAALVIIITMNWMAEFINAALEAAVNLASPQLHPMARVCKDVGAAAVLLAAVAAVLVGAFIFAPPLLERLVPLLAR
ncbi:MAG: diacylglycerol kinase family protein [Chloroflexi bacterium]|jgi:diacylglycerol kinase|nr:diacylglycerol kinase family protein [Chloroflexota bacterium]